MGRTFRYNESLSFDSRSERDKRKRAKKLQKEMRRQRRRNGQDRDYEFDEPNFRIHR